MVQVLVLAVNTLCQLIEDPASQELREVSGCWFPTASKV